MSGANGGIYIGGLWVSNGNENRGIHVINKGHSGMDAAGFANQANNTPFDSARTFSPDLVVISVGINDLNIGRTSAQYKTRLELVLTKFRTSLAAKPRPSC